MSPTKCKHWAFQNSGFRTMEVLMKKLLVACVAAAALSGAPALAADLPVKAPVYRAAPAPMFDWSGFYIGANVGYGWGSSDSSINVGTTFTGDTSPTGWIYGGHFGALKQFSNNWVLGAQVTLLGTSMKDTVDITNAPGFSRQVKFDGIGLAEAKLGYAMQSGMGPMLPYLSGGAACARSNSTISGGVTSVTSNKADQCGWTIGAGIDWATSIPNLIIGVKYNYADLGTKDHAYPLSSLGVPVSGLGLSVPESQRFNLIEVELSYKFGDWGKAPVSARY
jgi:outer membrane immunogenic protein